MADVAALKYRAFLSYGHADASWAKWLHGRLESFRFDKDLIGRETSLGTVPKTLRPIFRDREEFSGGHSLTAATIAALDASAVLIVLCSTVAATRPAVNEEVRLFRSRHPDRPVIPVIVEGTWPDNAPPALRHELSADGTVTERPNTILGPDLRESGDGKSLGLAKVVAGLTGLGADEIFRRAERERRRKGRRRNAIIAVLALLTVAATGSAVYAWEQLATNRAFLNETLKVATEIVDTAVLQAETYRVPRAATLMLLEKAEGLFDVMARRGESTPELRHRKAWMLIQFARSYAILGDTGKQLARASEAYRLLAELVAENSRDTTYQRDLAVAYLEIGDAQEAQGDLVGALKSFRESLAIRERLAQSDPDNAGRQHDLSVAFERIGNVQVAQGDLTGALKSYRDSLAIDERLAQSDPANADRQHDLSVAFEKIGDVQVAQGDLTGAMKSYRDSLAMRERLAQSDPGNAGWQRELSVAFIKVGDVQVAQGDLAGAMKSYRDSLAIAERLAQSDPGNTRWQQGLSVAIERLGNVQVAQADLTGAMTSYRNSLAIRKRLAQSDPGNAGSQRDLSVSFIKVGNVQVVQGDLAGALKSYHDSLVILERLVQSDPDNAGWQHDLSAAINKVGDVQGAQGDLTGAMKSYGDSLAIVERLAQSDPGNADWQRDLSVSISKIGDVQLAQGDLASALRSYRDSLAIVERLAQSDPGNASWQRDLSVAVEKLGNLAYRFVLAGDFTQGLDVADEAIARAPATTWLYINRGHALMLLGRVADARALYLRFRGTPKIIGDKSWEACVLDDFAELRQAGLNNSLMDEIETLFASRG